MDKLTVQPLNLPRSIDLLSRAKKCIPVQAQTFSKAPYYFVEGEYPVYVESGSGSRVTDVDGNKYLDYILGLGPVILGYQHPVVDEAIRNQLGKGISFSLSHRLEVELAELLCDIIPCAEMVRYFKTGSDGCSAAIRLARAYTGRDKVAYCGYHGWHDWYAVTTDLNRGIPSIMADYVLPFSYNDLSSLEKLFETHPNEIAAVSLEPVLLDAPDEGFLHEVQKIAHKNGAVLIFDEIITGFRYALGGAQELYGITPDLAVFGKAMGNGMPIGAVVGKQEIMSLCEQVFISSTFGGEALSLAASLATIQYLQDTDALALLWDRGESLQLGFNNLAKHIGVNAACIGLAPRMKIEVYDALGQDSLLIKSLFMQETIRRGVLFHPGIVYPMSIHSDADVNETLEVCKVGLEVVKDSLSTDTVEQRLKGKPASMVFVRIPGAKDPE